MKVKTLRAHLEAFGNDAGQERQFLLQRRRHAPAFFFFLKPFKCPKYSIQIPSRKPFFCMCSHFKPLIPGSAFVKHFTENSESYQLPVSFFSSYGI